MRWPLIGFARGGFAPTVGRDAPGRQERLDARRVADHGNLYYGIPAKHAYWNGFSTGGRQVCKLAQQYPVTMTASWPEHRLGDESGRSWTAASAIRPKRSQPVVVAKVSLCSSACQARA